MTKWITFTVKKKPNGRFRECSLTSQRPYTTRKSLEMSR